MELGAESLKSTVGIIIIIGKYGTTLRNHQLVVLDMQRSTANQNDLSSLELEPTISGFVTPQLVNDQFFRRTFIHKLQFQQRQHSSISQRNNFECGSRYEPEEISTLFHICKQDINSHQTDFVCTFHFVVIVYIASSAHHRTTTTCTIFLITKLPLPRFFLFWGVCDL